MKVLLIISAIVLLLLQVCYFTGETESNRIPKRKRRQAQGCARQTCDQTITGRNLPYQRILEIIQEEEYLEAADLDLTTRRRRSKRVKRQLVTIPILDFFNGASLEVFCQEMSIRCVRCVAEIACNSVCPLITSCRANPIVNFYTGESVQFKIFDECFNYVVDQTAILCIDPTLNNVLTALTPSSELLNT